MCAPVVFQNDKREPDVMVRFRLSFLALLHCVIQLPLWLLAIAACNHRITEVGRDLLKSSSPATSSFLNNDSKHLVALRRNECARLHTLTRAFFICFSDVDNKLPDFVLAEAWYIVSDKPHSQNAALLPVR